MPDPSGKLTQGERDHIVAWFKDHWKEPVTCPVCRSAEWAISDHVAKLIRWAPDALVDGTTAFPLVQVECKICSHVMLFGAASMGIMSVEPPNAFGLISNEPRPIPQLRRGDI
jgi:hypothetical protein